MSRLFRLAVLSIVVVTFTAPAVLMPCPAAADEDKVLNEEVVEYALAKSRSILRPHDELPLEELRKQIRAPYDAEMERFRAWLREEFAKDLDERWEEFKKARHDHAQQFAGRVESHCLEAMGRGRFHEAFEVHGLIYNGGGEYDGDGHKARLRMMAYDTYLRLGRQTADRLTQIGNRLIALHAGNRDPGFELAVAPPEDEGTDIDRLEEAREELATWQRERKHGCPRWPRRWRVNAGWNCHVGDRKITGNVFSVHVSLTNDYQPLARQMRERVEEMVRGNSWKLNEYAQSLGGRAAALSRFDEVMEVRSGSRFVVFRPRWIEQALIVLIPDGCDAMLVGVYASRDWPDDLVRRNPVVVDEIVRLLVEAFVGGGVSSGQAQHSAARMELAPLTSTNLTTSPDPKSTCSMQVTTANADGVPAGGVSVNFKQPELGSLSAMRVTTDARGQALVTYTAPTEKELAAAGQKEVTVYINAHAPATGADDTEALKVRSRTGALTASAEHEVLPAHPDYYNRIEFRFKAADKPDGSAYRARITATQQWGAVVKNIHEPGGSRTYEMDVWPNSGCAVYYHWIGPPSMMKAADETVTIEIPEKNLRYEVTFSVGMDLRIVAVERKHSGQLFPIMWEPFHVYVEDKFHPKADLEPLVTKFRIETDLEIEQTAYEAAAVDYSHGSLVSVLITRIEGLSINSLQQAVVWDAGSWEVKKMNDGRCVLIQRGKYEDDRPWQEYPAVVFWERGTYRFQFTIKPGPFDADPRNNALPSPSLEVEEFRGFSDEVIHTVFLPSLEFLAGASLSFTKEVPALLVKTLFCIKGLFGDICAKDYTNVLIDAWGCALTRLDKAKLPQKIKDTFKLQELGTYIASLAKGLYERSQAKGGHERGETAHTAGTSTVVNTPGSTLGSLVKGFYDEVQGKKGAMAEGLGKVLLGDRDNVTRTEQPQGEFALDDVLRVSRLAVKGMQGHYVVILQREGLRHMTARTSGGLQLSQAPAKLGPGNSSGGRIEESATTMVIPMRNDERLILELQGIGSHGQLITITPNRIGRYEYPGGSWQSTVTVDSSGRATFTSGQSFTSTHEPAAPGVSLAGTWKSNFGTMTITQEGNRIRGEYSHDRGKIEGTIEGNVVMGRWSEASSYKPPKDAGDFEFTLSADGNSFTGKWRYGFGTGPWKGDWKGTRQ